MSNFQALPLSAEDIAAAEFWTRVIRRGTDECWPWTGSINAQGYGRLRTGRRDVQAHRASCVLHGLELVPGQVVDHLCRNRRCVNPAHLEPTSVAVNTARGEGPTAAVAAARLAGMCVNGHLIAEVGLHKQGKGATCAECGRDRVRRYKVRKAGVVGEIYATPSGPPTKPITPPPPSGPRNPPPPPSGPRKAAEVTALALFPKAVDF